MYNVKNFTFKTETVKGKKLAKRQYLNNIKTRDLMKKINQLFKKKVEVPRIYSGKKQVIGTLINEEALLLAKFLRNERDTWVPRIPLLAST